MEEVGGRCHAHAGPRRARRVLSPAECAGCGVGGAPEFAPSQGPGYKSWGFARVMVGRTRLGLRILEEDPGPGVVVCRGRKRARWPVSRPGDGDEPKRNWHHGRSIDGLRL